MPEDDLSPLEWLGRLGPKLRDRAPTIDLWQRYYDGDQDLPSGPQQHRDAYRRFQRLARTNLCLLCVESRVHRTKVTGYRDGTPRGGNDADVWKLWQTSRLDSRQFGLWRKAWKLSVAYAIVGPDPRSARTPRVTIESPHNVYVELDPADSSVRRAAIRIWHDPLAKRWFATVWVPGWRYRYRSRNEVADSSLTASMDFTDRFWVQDDEAQRSSADVPVVPFWNGDEGDDPRAAFAAGLDVQNRLNLTVLNRLTAERYAAFRQKYLMNYVPEAEEDPETGLPIPGTSKAPFNPGADQVWTVPPPEPGEAEPKLGDFAQTDTSNMLRGTESDIRTFAATTITPVYYLPGGDLTNIAEGAIAALDAGYIASIRERMVAWSEGLEEVLQLCADIAELDRDLSASEIVWDPPETNTPASRGDYLTKMTGSGVPLPMAVEDLGWTPQRIDRLRTEMTQQQLRASLSATGGTAGTQPGVSAVPRATAPVAAKQPAGATGSTRAPGQPQNPPTGRQNGSQAPAGSPAE